MRGLKEQSALDEGAAKVSLYAVACFLLCSLFTITLFLVSKHNDAFLMKAPLIALITAPTLRSLFMSYQLFKTSRSLVDTLSPASILGLGLFFYFFLF